MESTYVQYLREVFDDSVSLMVTSIYEINKNVIENMPYLPFQRLFLQSTKCECMYRH